MTYINEQQHNSLVSVSGQIEEVVYRDGERRACKFRMCLDEDRQYPVVVWDGSPAAEINYEAGNWYEFENILVKQWVDGTELNATSKTNMVHVKSTSDSQSGQDIDCLTDSNDSTSECSTDSSNKDTSDSSNRKDAGSETTAIQSKSHSTQVNQRETTPENKLAGNAETSSTNQPQPNAITELYVALWSMRTVIEGVLAHEETEVSGGTDHPLAQYRDLLNKFCWGTSLVEETIPGYGTLQGGWTSSMEMCRLSKPFHA